MHLGENGINYFINPTGVAGPAVPSRSGDNPLPDRAGGGLEYRPACKAENVFVLIKIEKSVVHVEIEDDGDGFDLDSPRVWGAAKRRTGAVSASWA